MFDPSYYFDITKNRACYRRSLEMGGHSSNVGPGRPNVEPTVGAIQESMQDALEIAKQTMPEKGDTLKEPPSQEMVLDDEKNGNAK